MRCDSYSKPATHWLATKGRLCCFAPYTLSTVSATKSTVLNSTLSPASVYRA